MDFKEDEDHRLIRESIRKLCDGFPDDYWEQHDREGIFPDEFFKEMAAAGWIGTSQGHDKRRCRCCRQGDSSN